MNAATTLNFAIGDVAIGGADGGQWADLWTTIGRCVRPSAPAHATRSSSRDVPRRSVAPMIGRDHQAADSDDALIARCAQGDRAAFAELMDRHADRAFAVAVRLLGNRADAEDAVQDAFIRAWHRAGAWEPGRAQFSTWLYRVVTNACIDRQRRRRPQTAIDDVAEPMDERPDPHAELEDSRRADALAAATQALPDAQRQAIALCFGAGISNRDAADTMNISVKALESLLIRAKRAMRQSLAADW